jgi:hypothetical protein
MRSSSTFNEDLAVAAYEDLADSVKGFNYNNSACAGCTNQFLPAIPTGHQGAALRLNGFPDNFVDTNPQFGSATIQNNSGYNNYHSFQAQLTTRPIQGFSGSINYNWSKNLGLGAIANPVERAVNYTNIGSNPGHSIRTNGTIELPIGPNKLFFGNSSGWVARAIERWQLGLIYNLSSGAPTSITAETMLYGNGLPDVRHHIDFNKIKGVRWGIPGGNNNQFLEGRYFDNGETFVKVSDPLCDTVTNLQNLRARGDCNLDALAMVVPDGTEDSFLLPDGRRVQILLQHAQPGKKGNLGNNTVVGLGSWRFDANLGKTFQITESKSLQVRFDAQNILNHPQPGNPSLNINAADAFGNSIPFGQITTKTGTRLLQGQLRLSF